MSNYIKEHWLGKQSLTRSLGLNAVALNICLVFSLTVVTKWLRFNSSISDYSLLFLLLLIWMAVLSWQTIGAFRSATKRIENYGSASSYYLVIALMLPCGVYALSSIANQLGDNIDYAQKEVDEYRPAMPTYNLKLIEFSKILLSGDIGYGATRKLKALLEQFPGSDQLILESDGGVIVEARGLAKLVKEHDLNTTVSTRCYSACTLVFIAGRQRTLGQNAQLGFHQYEVYSKSPLPWIKPAEEQLKDLQYFEEKNVASWFLEKIYSTPHSDIWTPSADTLFAAGVITLNSP